MATKLVTIKGKLTDPALYAKGWGLLALAIRMLDCLRRAVEWVEGWLIIQAAFLRKEVPTLPPMDLGSTGEAGGLVSSLTPKVEQDLKQLGLPLYVAPSGSQADSGPGVEIVGEKAPEGIETSTLLGAKEVSKPREARYAKGAGVGSKVLTDSEDAG